MWLKRIFMHPLIEIYLWLDGIWDFVVVKFFPAIEYNLKIC